MKKLFDPTDAVIGDIYDQIEHQRTIDLPVFRTKGKTMTREQFASLVETAFWASLRSNEGRMARFSAAALSPLDFRDAVVFETPVEYSESAIAKLAPSVPKSGCFLVDESSRGFQIWGFGRSRSFGANTLWFEVTAPGVVRVNVGLYEPGVVLDGRYNPRLWATRANIIIFFRMLLGKINPDDPQLDLVAGSDCVAFADLARMIVADGHGGTVLIVPNETGDWEKSLSPFPYRFTKADTHLPDAIRAQQREQSQNMQDVVELNKSNLPLDLKNRSFDRARLTQADVPMEVGIIASLAAVDGAIVITRDLRVIGFGATIVVKKRTASKLFIVSSERESENIKPGHLKETGGTRHQSSTRFVNAHKDTVAMVVSQDRHLSVVYWDARHKRLIFRKNVDWFL